MKDASICDMIKANMLITIGLIKKYRRWKQDMPIYGHKTQRGVFFCKTGKTAASLQGLIVSTKIAMVSSLDLPIKTSANTMKRL